MASDSIPSHGPRKQRAADDREVVEAWRDRRGAEAAACVEHARRDGAEREQHRREQHDPRQSDGQLRADSVETRA